MIRVVHPGYGSWIRILTFCPSRIKDPGVKKAPDPRSGSAHRKELFNFSSEVLHMRVITSGENHVFSFYNMVSIVRTGTSWYYVASSGGKER
jgi:hypothetical protein